MRVGGKELAFITTVLAVNAFIVLQGTGVFYEAFSWKAFAQVYEQGGAFSIGDGTEDPDADAIFALRDGQPNTFNPSGCLYNEVTGVIVPGGSVTAAVSCSSTANIPNGGDPMDGSMGCFAFSHPLDCDPTYTFTITPLTGCVVSTTCPDQGSVQTTNLSPSGELYISIGNFPATDLSEVSNTCTPWYSQIQLDAQDGSGIVNAVINNNVALDCSALCGNNVLDTAVGEQCDDGNQMSGDGCDENCLGPEEGFTCPENMAGACEPICGDTLVVGDEECDDGNLSNNDSCLNDCTAAACGDTFLCTDVATCSTGPEGGTEECDDGNTADNDACLGSCAIAICGDNVVCTDEATCTTGPEGGVEECDEGMPTTTCTADCGNQSIPAPAVDARGVAAAVLALLALGVVALRRRSRATTTPTRS